VINTSALMVKALAAQMKATLAALKGFEAEIETLCRSHQDYPLFASLPGSGTVYSSRLLAAFGTDRGRFGSADEVARLAGIAPVLERSGKSTWVRWRYFCPKFLRQTFHEYAGESVRHSAWAQAYYTAQRAKGKSHQAAVRALAFKWVRVIWKCWQAQVPYDEARYLESLRRRGSPLVSLIESAQA
jgi:transposase